MTPMKRGKHSFSKFSLTGICLLALLMGAVILVSSSSFSDEDELVAAPLNKEFLKYLEMQKQGQFLPMYTTDGHPLGHIPDPVDIYYIEELEDEFMIDIDTLPAKYDLRNKNKLPEIRNQGSCGSCWAFSTMASLESSFWPQENWDFSEQHLIKTHGFALKPCAGGSLGMATAYLARWDGPIGETDMPYVYTAYVDAQKYEIKKHVQNVIFIPQRKGPKDNNKLKKAVMKYGAVYTSMFYDDSCYNPAHTAYYNKDIQEGGHGVNIVGWDNTFSKDKFNESPPGNGAFIVRNSWGTDYGENGYFYVSYHDEYFAKRGFNAAHPKPEENNNYEEIYEYDPSGWTESVGFGRTTAWFANIFEAKSNRSLQAVSFHAVGLNNNYTIYIYTGVENDKPRSGILARTKSGQKKEPGYYTIEIPKVALTKGEKFSVVVKLKTKGLSFPIPIEQHFKGYTKKKNARAKKGQSFVSGDGESWLDITKAYEKNTNVCIKAFAN